MKSCYHIEVVYIYAAIGKATGLREQMEDLNDCLDLLDARARNQGKPTFTTAEVRKQLGLA